MRSVFDQYCNYFSQMQPRWKKEKKREGRRKEGRGVKASSGVQWGNFYRSGSPQGPPEANFPEGIATEETTTAETRVFIFSLIP